MWHGRLAHVFQKHGRVARATNKMTPLPAYLDVAPEKLGEGTRVKVRVLGDMASIAHDMAEVMAGEIRSGAKTLIVPVGPVDQFPIFAEMINKEHVDCREVCFINMDEYLDENDRWIDLEHPLSFRGFMNRLFYDRLNPELSPRAENRVFPDPRDCGAIGKVIEQRGGVDVCFGGIGING